jgi:DNA-binding LacI/PurR family transcriptional regulator
MLDELRNLKMQIPEDPSIVGFGDELEYSWWGAGVTTVRLPVAELATACGLWFLHQLREKRIAKGPHSSISAPELVVRGTTTPPRSGR